MLTEFLGGIILLSAFNPSVSLGGSVFTPIAPDAALSCGRSIGQAKPGYPNQRMETLALQIVGEAPMGSKTPFTIAQKWSSELKQNANSTYSVPPLDDIIDQWYASWEHATDGLAGPSLKSQKRSTTLMLLIVSYPQTFLKVYTDVMAGIQPDTDLYALFEAQQAGNRKHAQVFQDLSRLWDALLIQEYVQRALAFPFARNSPEQNPLKVVVEQNEKLLNTHYRR